MILHCRCAFVLISAVRMCACDTRMLMICIQVESHDRVLVKAVRKMDRSTMDTIIEQAAAAGLDSMQVQHNT
jgi:hypothetical protein